MTEQRTHLLKVVMLLQHLHRDAVTEIVGLQFRAADLRAVHLAESPNILAGHGCPCLADRAPPPRRPESGVSGPSPGGSRRVLSANGVATSHDLDLTGRVPRHVE